SGIERIDPATGADLGPYTLSPVIRFIIQLHRSLLLGDNGRIVTAIGALGLMGLGLTGLSLLARRAGGWRRLLDPVKGRPATVLHGTLGQLAIVGLILSSLTGLWMSANSFGLLPEAPLPAQVTAADGQPVPVGSLAALKAIDVADLSKLTFPSPVDPTDVYEVKTTAVDAMVDPTTGDVLQVTPLTFLQRFNAFIAGVHTGRGMAALGILLGLSAATIPVFGWSGIMVWARRRSLKPRIAGNAAAKSANVVILVGSEGQTTWGFAATLHQAFVKVGAKVHTTAMNDLSPDHMQAALMLILTSTAGDGAAPASATGFADRLKAVPGSLPVAVLGFGDKTFPNFCGYAHAVEAALERRGWQTVMPLRSIDRQSAQEFAQWGRDLGALFEFDLTLEHVAEPPATQDLELISREDYGHAIGTPIAVLRFRRPRGRFGRGRMPQFAAGDLLGVVPPGSASPRFYSLASGAEDGFVEICVRLRDGGLCSGHLHGLAVGDRIASFVRENPTFRPVEGQAPVILIGAGAGIGPLAGFVRANTSGRPLHLYWGGRRPDADFLYQEELAEHLAERRLTSLRAAFSRIPRGAAYVQDHIAADADLLRHLIRQGGQIVVCGGRDMAEAVTHTLERIVHPLGLDTATMKLTGRYVEDVY
ncbi:MAG: PepSY domain-containing protein, partial [Ancalomicrobiaceae bacterium]|nr:PepSY domain-containing protein [Ancalomicrobiaceae bacterium]